MANIGFVGLGVMGTAMSTHLLSAGFTVTGYDIDPDRVKEHKARGGRVADNPAEAAARAGVVVTSLPNAAALRSVVDGPDGLICAIPPLVVIETSTLPLEAKAEARVLLRQHGMTLLDCPLSGTGAQAARGDVVAYVSGADRAKQTAAPILDAFTRRWYDVGEFGNGMKMKMVANLLVIVHNMAAAEALILAERAGLPLQDVLTAVGDGAGMSRMFEVRGPVMVSEDYDVPGATTSVLAKDSEIITEFAASRDIPVPLLTASAVFYHAAIAQGRGDQEAACVHAVLKQMGGLSVDDR
jgi:putative dehydrogenase